MKRLLLVVQAFMVFALLGGDAANCPAKLSDMGRPVLKLALTFDDGTKDQLEVAAPLLAKHGWKATFNIVTDWIGRPGKFTWDDVRSLHRMGHEIASHTVTHPDLRGLLSKGETNEVRRQYRESRERIRREIGMAPSFMCYPFTERNDATDAICREEGMAPMLIERYNFGEGTKAGTPTGVGAVIDKWLDEGRTKMDVLVHGVRPGGGWCPFDSEADYAAFLDEIADRERRGFVKIVPYAELLPRQLTGCGGSWITVSDPSPAGNRTTEYVKTFVNRANVKKAVWTMTGLGVFDAYVNGELVGDDILKPGYTHFARTKYLYAYDVTKLVKGGKGAKNVLSAVQSGGWWSDRCVWGFKNGTKRKNAFLAELVLTYEDGSEDRIVTDPTWRAAYAGPIVKASIWDGETYDARIEPTWRVTGDCAFPAASVDSQFKGEVLPLVGPKVVLREDLVLRPVTAKVWRDAEGATDTKRFGKIKVLRTVKSGKVSLSVGEKLLLDFGQNASAVPRLVASAKSGVKVVIRVSEMLNDGDGLKSRGNDGPGGSPYYTNYRSTKETNFTYVFAGRGVETISPRHTFFGCRYFQLEADGPVEIHSVVSVPVTSVAKDQELGTVVTGDDSINRLIKNCVWGMYSNYLSVPTDCPQRDERQGWTGDTQVFSLTASYVADVSGFHHKWMRDMRDSQNLNGGFADVAPCGDDTDLGWGGNCGRHIGWGDAGVIVPHTIWRQFGDTTIVNENWAAMVKYMDLLEKSKYRTVVGTKNWGDGGFQFADWLSYERWEACANWSALQKSHEVEDYWNLLGASYWVLDARMMSEMAAATGRKADAKRFAEMASAALAYMRKEFLAKDGLLLEKFRDMQTANLFALKIGLFETAEAKARSVQILRDNFAAHGGCLQTGFLGTSILLDAVAEHLSVREAYDLLFQRKEPSWLFTVDNGATTMWERWNSYTKSAGFGKAGMNSFNHYAYGAVLGWIFKSAAGIASDVSAPGFKKIVLSPAPDRRLGFIRAEYKSAAGVIKSSWRYEGDKWLWDFTIPEGAAASVTIPGESVARAYRSGTYHVERTAK